VVHARDGLQGRLVVVRRHHVPQRHESYARTRVRDTTTAHAHAHAQNDLHSKDYTSSGRTGWRDGSPDAAMALGSRLLVVPDELEVRGLPRGPRRQPTTSHWPVVQQRKKRRVGGGVRVAGRCRWAPSRRGRTPPPSPAGPPSGAGGRSTPRATTLLAAHTTRRTRHTRHTRHASHHRQQLSTRREGTRARAFGREGPKDGAVHLAAGALVHPHALEGVHALHQQHPRRLMLQPHPASQPASQPATSIHRHGPFLNGMSAMCICVDHIITWVPFRSTRRGGRSGIASRRGTRRARTRTWPCAPSCTLHPPHQPPSHPPATQPSTTARPPARPPEPMASEWAHLQQRTEMQEK
jgi:hypothetical protein